MKSIKKSSCLVLFFIIFCLTSCRSHEDLEEKYYTTAELMLQKTFLNKFGIPASTHKWHNVAKRLLEISLPPYSEKITVSVYSSDPTASSNNAVKLAEYIELEPSQAHKLPFECSAGISDIYIAVICGKNVAVSSPISVDGSGICHYALSEAPTASKSLYSTDMQYIFAYEDLGVAVDLDYNDIVLGVTHVSGRKEIKIRLWAVGTFIYAYAYFNEIPLFEGMELHEILGLPTSATANVFTSGNTFNLDARKNSKYNLAIYPELQETIKVPEDFCLIDNVDSFIVKTMPKRECPESDIKKITLPTKDGAFPYAVMVADPYWCWPTEKTSIDIAYPKFAEWVSNSQLYYWYK